MKLTPLLIALALVVLLSINGCANLFLGTTTAHFKTPEGLEGNYVSSKNQENMHVIATVGPDGKIKSISIKTTSTTPADAMSATTELYSLMFQEIKDLSAKAAAAGAGS